MECKRKCDLVIRERKRKEVGSPINQIVTVPHCYPSVVHNTLEIICHHIVGVRVIVHVIETKGTSLVMRGGVEVNVTTRTEVTTVITQGTMTMGASAVVETMGGMGGGVALIDIREAMSMG